MIQPLKTGFSSHNVKCKAAIGQFKEGQDYQIQIIPMTGRIYKPGKTPDGKEWLDKVGEPDNRMMVMALGIYQVFTDMGFIHHSFQE